MAFREIDDGLWDIVRKYLPPTKPNIGRPRRTPANCSTASCTSWPPAAPGTIYWQTTIPNRRFTGTPRIMREGSVPSDLPRPAPIWAYDPKKIDLSHCATDTKDIPAKKGGPAGYDSYKTVKGTSLSVLANLGGLLLTCTVPPANVHDSRLYEPTLKAFEISEAPERPIIISADVTYDAREIRQYNWRRGIKSDIPVNRRSRRHPKQGRPFWFGPVLYKKRSAVERFFSWIEAFKMIVPRYERYEHSFLGLMHLACVVMIGRVLG